MPDFYSRPQGYLRHDSEQVRPRDLALQLPFCLEVCALGGSLVSSAPAGPCDDVCGLNTLPSESDGNAADFLD